MDCVGLYRSERAGQYLRWFALLAPMLYCDAIVDALNKGLGQQKICVRFNILTSALDVIFLFLLLPRYGMRGYFLSFLVTHAINAALSLWLLLKSTGMRLRPRMALMACASFLFAVFAAKAMPWQLGKPVIFLLAALIALYVSEVLRAEDRRWLLSLVRLEKNSEKNK